jgi:hypothetical protein
MNQAPACLRCIHYQVTFDPAAPRGCKLYSIKSSQFPSIIVRMSTGKDCPDFKLKTRNQSDSKDSFDDPKYWGEDK